MKRDWKEVATDLFHEYRYEANRYAKENENVESLALLNAGKAVAMSHLLDLYGAKPEPNKDK